MDRKNLTVAAAVCVMLAVGSSVFAAAGNSSPRVAATRSAYNPFGMVRASTAGPDSAERRNFDRRQAVVKAAKAKVRPPGRPGNRSPHQPGNPFHDKDGDGVEDHGGHGPNNNAGNPPPFTPPGGGTGTNPGGQTPGNGNGQGNGPKKK